MTTGVSERDIACTVEWLGRRCLPLPLPREAGDLLAVRLAARRRIGKGGLAVLVTCGIGGFALNVMTSWDISPESAGRFRWQRLIVVALYCLVPVLFAAGLRLAIAADRRITRSLARPVASVDPAPIMVVLGRERVAATVGVLVLCGVSGAVTWMTESEPAALGVTVLVAVALGSSVFALRLALTRPVVAHDGLTLVLDERLRSEEAALASAVTVSVLFALGTGPMDVDRAAGHLVHLGCALAASILISVAELLSWRRGRRTGTSRGEESSMVDGPGAQA